MIKTLKQISQWECLVLFIISSSVCLTFLATIVLYPIDINYLHLLNIVAIDWQSLLNNYYQLLAYLFLPWLTHLVMPNFLSSVNGLAHFAAVKHLLLFNNLVMLISGYVAIKFLITLYQQHRLKPLRYLASGLLITLGIVITLMLHNFDRFFVIFHQILFHNQDWLFDPNTDPIINVLPTTFFEQCFILFGIFILIWIGSCFLLSSIKNR